MRKGDSITTYTGRNFYVLDPRPEDVADVDIAHALSLLCRGNGHYRHFYSVGQHSLNCLEEARARGYSPRLQMACLVHDGSEAYLSDITRPVKQYLTAYKTYEHTIQNMLFAYYGVDGLTEAELRQVAAVDDCVLYYEFEVLHQKMQREAPERHALFDFSLRRAKDVENRFLTELNGLRSVLKQSEKK